MFFWPDSGPGVVFSCIWMVGHLTHKQSRKPGKRKSYHTQTESNSWANLCAFLKASLNLEGLVASDQFRKYPQSTHWHGTGATFWRHTPRMSFISPQPHLTPSHFLLPIGPLGRPHESDMTVWPVSHKSSQPMGCKGRVPASGMAKRWSSHRCGLGEHSSTHLPVGSVFLPFLRTGKPLRLDKKIISSSALTNFVTFCGDLQHYTTIQINTVVWRFLFELHSCSLPARMCK